MDRKVMYMTLFGMYIIMSLLLTGCWDSTEINKRNVIMDIGLDKINGQDNDSDIENRDYYKITYMIPDMAQLAGESSFNEEVKNRMVVKSPTLTKSVEDIEIKTENTVTFSHTKAVFFGEELLKDKKLMRSAINSLLANDEIGRGVNLLAVKGAEAGDLVQAKSTDNPLIGLYVMNFFDNNEKGASYARKQSLGRFVRDIDNNNITTIPQIAMDSNEGMLKIAGGAVIKDYELVGWLNRDEVRGQMFVNGEIKSVPIVVEYQDEPLTYQITHEKSKIKFNEDGGQVQATIVITVDGDITEYVSNMGQIIFNNQQIQEVNQILSKHIKDEIEHTIEISKKMNADFLDIGLEMQRRAVNLWDKCAPTWEESGYINIPINVEVRTVVHNAGELN